MKAAKILALLVLTPFLLSAQSSYDPYEGHEGETFELEAVYPISLSANYIGEYQIFLDDFHWGPNLPGNITYKIEAVSFPFVPVDQMHMAGDRKMVMPDLESYAYRDRTGCSGWSWDENNPTQEPDEGQLMRIISGGFGGNTSGGNEIMSQYATLASIFFRNADMEDECGEGGFRNILPHTILKHTLYASNSAGIKMDSVSWVYDNTRGKMRAYPFCDPTGSGSRAWDLTFRPKILHDPNGHQYASTENATWYYPLDPTIETANQFPTPYNYLEDILFPLYPTDLSTTFIPDPDNSVYSHPPPYALLEAPLLNVIGNAYPGYYADQSTNYLQTSFFDGMQDPADWNVPHTYYIDKPIDLTLINSFEKIIYNPSEAIIEMDAQYAGEPLVFPSGYTFRTVHGTHPSRTTVELVDPDYLYPNPLLAPVPSSLGTTSSVYRITDSNHLIIEPCVTIMDAEIIVESGGVLSYEPNFVYGNFTVTNNGGTVVTDTQPFPELPCVSDCYNDEFMDVKDFVVDGEVTWTTSALPYDDDQDGVIKIAGRVRVVENTHLTIEPDVRLEFGPHGRIIIERGARVDADGVTFTAACNSMWHGIEVWGTRDEAQYPTVGNSLQGVFSAVNCTFEHAREAVRVFRSDDPSASTQAGTGWDFNGGVFQGNGNTFLNNYRGVHIRPTTVLYNNVEIDNACHILQSSFICDDYLLDPAYHDGFGLRRASIEQVRLHGVTDVVVSYCQFSTSLPANNNFPPHLRGTGVFTLDASQTISASQFSGLSEGVWHALGSKFLYGQTRIRNNNFTDCIHAIVAVGSELDEITGNTINVPTSPQYGFTNDDLDQGYDYPVGIYCQGNYNYHVEGNIITGNETDGSASLWSYGIVANESNGDNANATSLIYLNTISDVNVGIQCEGDNRGNGGSAGLLLECNDFQQGLDVFNHDITVVSNWIDGNNFQDGYLRDQGGALCDDQDLYPANKFSGLDADVGTLDHLYFDNYTLGQNFFFWYRGELLPASGAHNIPNIENCPFSFERDCQPIVDCGKPCLIVQQEKLVGSIVQLQDEIGQAADPEVIAQLQAELDHNQAQLNTVWNSLARNALEYETLDSLFMVWNKDKGISKHRKLVAFYVAKGQLTQADSLIDLIIDEEGVPSDHTILMQLKISINGAIEALTPPQKQELENMVEGNPLGAPAAKAMLRQVDGTPYHRVPWMLNDTRPGLKDFMEEVNREFQFEAWPNPTSNSLNIKSNTTIRSIRFISIDGRAVQPNFEMRNDIAICNVEEFAIGCYVIEVVSDTGQIAHKVIIISNNN